MNKIEFENGSIIESIDTNYKTIRSKAKNMNDVLYILSNVDKPVKIVYENKYTIKQIGKFEFEITDNEPDMPYNLNYIKIKDGLKVEVRDYVLDNLLQEDYIQNNFKLNIKRLNRWWYSVYFAEKKLKDDYYE